MDHSNGKLEELPHVLRVEQAASILGIGRNSAYRAISMGQIPSIKIGKRICVPRKAIERLIDKATETLG